MKWAGFLTQVAKGNLAELKTWAQVGESLDVTVTPSPAEAQNCFCDGLESAEPFPLDRVWIPPTSLASHF
jgi:hypothetical protein